MLNFATISFVSMLAFANGMPGTAPDFATRVIRDDLSTPDIESIKAVPTTAFTSYTVGGLVRASNINESALERRWTCGTDPIFTWGDADDGGLGVTVTNADSVWRGFYIYHNDVRS